MGRALNVKLVVNDVVADVQINTMPFEMSYKGQKLKTKGTRPAVNYLTPEGKETKFTRVDKKTGDIVGATSNMYQDEDDKLYDKNQLVPHLVTEDGKEIPTQKNQKTDTWQIDKFESLSNYLDKYQMEKYYYVSPSQGKSDKDFQRELTKNTNIKQMKKIWDKLHSKELVARGKLFTTSSGFVPSYGYLRAVEPEPGKWALEVGIFKQKKVFGWMEDQGWSGKTASQIVNKPQFQQAEVDEI